MRNKTLYLLGSAASNFGDGIQQIAITWYIYHLTGEALSIGFIIGIYYLPSILLTPLVSVYVDYHSSKNIVITTDFCRFFIVLGMSILIIIKIESVAILYILQFLLAVCYTFYKPAEQSFIKESFSNREIPFIISKSSSINETALLAGSAISGLLLIKISLFTCFLLNSLTFFAAGFSYIFIKRINKNFDIYKKIAYLRELISGWSYIKQKNGLKYLLFLSILNSLSIQMTTTILLPLATELRGGSGLYSLFDLSFSIGGIISGFIVTFFLKKWKQKVLIITMVGMAVSSLSLYFHQSAITTAIFISILGLFTMSHLVITQTAIQLNTPKTFIGRVIGLRTILASVVKITSAVGTGALISKIGIHNVFLFFTCILGICFFTLKNLGKISITGDNEDSHII
jgi:MFS family permease